LTRSACMYMCYLGMSVQCWEGSKVELSQEGCMHVHPWLQSLGAFVDLQLLLHAVCCMLAGYWLHW
jgi:hypothetical protein